MKANRGQPSSLNVIVGRIARQCFTLSAHLAAINVRFVHVPFDGCPEAGFPGRRIAGQTAWKRVIMAFQACFPLRLVKKTRRKLASDCMHCYAIGYYVGIAFHFSLGDRGNYLLAAGRVSLNDVDEGAYRPPGSMHISA